MKNLPVTDTLLFANIFLLFYSNNSPAINSDINLTFTMPIKNDRQNRLHLGKRPFWNNFETFDREIIIEHKQKPKRYFNI